MASLSEAAERMKARIESLRSAPEAAIAAADKQLISALPVFTGAYVDAVKVEPLGEGAYSLQVTLPDLLASVQSALEGAAEESWLSKENPVDYVYAEVMPGPEGPYPLRIEESGSPKQGKGQGAWAQAAETARQSLHTALKKAAS